MLLAQENLDPSLAIAQVIQADNHPLPEHDQLFLDKKEAIREAEAEKADTMEDPVEASLDEPSPEDGSGDSPDEDSEVLEDKQTTMATESLRHELTFALESEYGESGTSAFFSALSGYAKAGLTELFGCLKYLGVTYGPTALTYLKLGVVYLLTRIFRLFMKMTKATVVGYRKRRVKYTAIQQQLERYQATLEALMSADTVLSSPTPFQDEKFFKMLEVNGSLSVKKSQAAVITLLTQILPDLDKGMEHDVRVIEHLIDGSKRGLRFSPISYMTVNLVSSGFVKQSVQGYVKNPELIESYVAKQALPNDGLMLFGLPKPSVIQEAETSGDTTDIAKAYTESFIAIGVNPVKSNTAPYVNYMDKGDLKVFLEGLIKIAGAAAEQAELYKNVHQRSKRLKISYRTYLSWLITEKEQKSLNDSLAELVFLKQSFVARVYLPAMFDIHDYVATYLRTGIRYVEQNLKVITLKDSEKLAD